MPTNLMPEGFEKAPQKKDHLKLTAGLLALVLFIWLASLGANFWLKNKSQDTETQINNINEQIEASLGSQTATLVRKLEEVSRLLNKRVYWSDFLTRLEKNTLSSTIFNSFSGKAAEESSVSLQGSFDNYTSLAQQVLVFKDVFKSVDFSLTGGEDADQEGDSEEGGRQTDGQQEGEGDQQEDTSKIQASLELTF